VDAPEIEEECEQERRLALKARDGLRSMLDGAGQVFLEQVKRGKYAGRVVARVIGPNGRNVADAMIQAGHGRPYQGGNRQGWCAEK
jgi:endonuclease YncB( thermonuclease family)